MFTREGGFPVTLEESIAEVLGDNSEDFLVIHVGTCQREKGECTCLPFRIPMEEAQLIGAPKLAEMLSAWVDDA